MAHVIKNLFSAQQSDSRIEIVVITPEFAQQILDMNTDNFRTPDKRRVQAYANAISGGIWELTGDTIKINGSVLIDGQHRLMAVILAGKPIKTAVAWNVAESALHVDKGKPRTVSQWLKHLGMKNTNSLAATALLAIQHNKGKWGRHKLQFDEYQDTDIINYAMEHHDSLNASVRIASKCRGLVYQSVAAAIIHIGCGMENPEEDDIVRWFWDGVGGAGELEETDPPLVLRNRLVASKLSKNATMNVAYTRWICTIAWNKAVLGEQITPAGLRLRSVGPQKHNPPERIIASSEG